VQLTGERRKVVLGDCGRAYGTGCVHEMACERCSLFRIDPAQRPRLVIIRDSRSARITEATEQGWLGELKGLQVFLAAVRDKLQALDARLSRQPVVTDLGMPPSPASRQPPARNRGTRQGRNLMNRGLSSPHLLADPCACARDIYPDEAAVELLINHGTFLHRRRVRIGFFQVRAVVEARQPGPSVRSAIFAAMTPPLARRRGPRRVTKGAGP
jgi:hypothetical protein